MSPARLYKEKNYIDIPDGNFLETGKAEKEEKTLNIKVFADGNVVLLSHYYGLNFVVLDPGEELKPIPKQLTEDTGITRIIALPEPK